MAGSIIDLNGTSFEDAIGGTDKPVLVDFWAPWCGPCRSIAPILEELADELGDDVQICKVDVDQNQDIAGRFNVRAIPTMLLFKSGQVVDTIVGLSSKEDLKGKLMANV